MGDWEIQRLSAWDKGERTHINNGCTTKQIACHDSAVLVEDSRMPRVGFRSVGVAEEGDNLWNLGSVEVGCENFGLDFNGEN